MLSNETKRIIDDAKDTLVGQIPVPMMQCQQITLALTYKFMSDDDQQAVDLGGRRHYFTGDLEQYEWSRVVSLRLDDTQRSELYRNGLAALQESESLPAVFREIFKDAVVPYGDHRTLALFLQTMDRMEYDDSEKLGDAYEYLLKIAESQADAGQFRTPRHIIDFIVNIINPQKHEVIIDPACGTAGFLISAYQHVKNQHRLSDDGTTLSIPDLTRLTDNLKGYDISPEMTKLAMANMYLHTQDKNPHIDNYDTLTSTDHWNEFADVMLANPPFMTPRGGIKPHGLFRVPAKRAEVLFVDYIASHLNEYGRAGIIVPEGIIFQSQNAYKQLRRLLLDESLVAVISLPGGIFKPYSGVKTSILILDKVLAPKTDRVAFFKVENDGYDLGDQRRPIGKDDLPTVTDEVNEYLRRLRGGESLNGFALATGLMVEKERVAEDGDYNLSRDRYQNLNVRNYEYPLVPLAQISELLRGVTFRKSDQLEAATNDSIHVVTTRAAQESGIVEEDLYHIPTKLVKEDKKLLRPGDILISTANSLNLLGRTSHVKNIDHPTSFGAFMSLIRSSEEVLDTYLLHCLRTERATNFFRRNANTTTNISNLNISTLARFEIPLPPLEVQREIVAEIKGYQRVIDGARAVVDNWRPRFAVDPEWPTVSLGEVVSENPKYGSASSKADFNGEVRYVRISDITPKGQLKAVDMVSPSEIDQQYFLELDDLLIARSGSVGRTYLHEALSTTHQYAGYLIRFRIDSTKALSKYVYQVTKSEAWDRWVQQNSKVGTISNINAKQFSSFTFPLPPLMTQTAIVAELNEEQTAVDQAEKLAAKMEQRIQGTIARVWEG